MAASSGGSAPLILVTNDDGIDAPGLWDLVRALDGLGDLAVVAPAREQSWAGRAHRSDPDGGPAADLIGVVASTPRTPPDGAPVLRCCIAVAATPARCVRLALTGMGLRPALLLAGINPGTNGGALLTASGTLGAAWEAAGSGVPAVAISRPAVVDGTQTDAVLAHVRAIAVRALDGGLPAGTAVVNVNFPDRLAPDARWTVTTTSTRSPFAHVMAPVDRPVDRPVDSPVGTTVWGLHFVNERLDDVEPGSDLAALAGGDVSLTLLPARHGLLDDSWVPAERLPAPARSRG